MEKRFSDMTIEELRDRVAELTEQARKAEQMGMVNEYAVHQRKIIMAKSYMMNPAEYQVGEVYEIEGDPGIFFEIVYMNGVFAWGYRLSSQGERLDVQGSEEQEAMPISMFGERVQL
ncbi:YfhH family protein [Pontibacillus sp. ALD_SL1]|uniref:YfhH family protein n=1 Tax=Pontibacillus sp. ALD_SL1 TaxID=2777185 RepID=UPI001A95C0E7|nr:YfhH family protein [Pontibacillus sp. ALD_SL1]QST00536.1 YfhH family protein [Pontibacillus sp. ALD_SL1]